MVYNIKITQKERLLDCLCISQEDAWINGMGFIKETCDIVIICGNKLEQKHIDYIVETKKICYKSHEELYIDNQYCYFIYPDKRRKRKCS
jgi:hypothetical protein